MRIIKVVVLTILGFVLTLPTAHAENLAFVIGNHKYQRASWMYDAENAGRTAAALRNSGYTVFRVSTTSSKTRNALPKFANRLANADRIVVLNSHFVHSDRDSWFLPIDVASDKITRRAIRKFQRTPGFPVTGYLTARTSSGLLPRPDKRR